VSLGDDGTAILEFVSLVVIVVIPLTYLILTAFDVQRAAFGTSSAAREAGRVFVLGSGTVDAEHRARVAAGIVLADQSIRLGAAEDTSLQVACSAQPCLTPGASVTVTVTSRVQLPLVPAFLSRIVPVSVPVSSRYEQVVDSYLAPRP